MKKLLVVLGLFVFVQSQIFSQSTNFSLSGVVLDNTAKEKIEYASIRVLTPKDSTYVAGGSTNQNGQFSISLKPAKYIVKVSYLGYQDHTVDVNLNKNTSLGDIFMMEDAVMLNEAVVETKAIEIMVKGDTVEYNADSYKVQESAVVEDLLKKMPGVEIDADGKITVNGKEIKKIMLDGKEYFSNDPKVASKNLPARMIDKLQVLDKKSDMSLMTGFDDGEEETIINLTVKAGMKEGINGNGLTGYGSKDKYEGATNVNYMKNNTLVSLIGGINNTNNAGASDLASAMFSNSEGGRGSRGMRFGGQNGVTKSITGGINFATEYSDKLKWGGDVRYGNNDNDVISNSATDYTTNEALKKRSQTSNSMGNNKSQSFATNLKFEWTPDELTKIIFRPTIQYNTSDNTQTADGETLFTENKANNYSNQSRYISEGKGHKLNGNLDLSRKLSDKGRVISVGISGGLNQSEDNGLDYTKIKYVSKPDSIIDLQFFQDNDSHNWRIFTSYVEPLKNNNFLELSYNISNNNSETDRNSYYNKGLSLSNPNYSELDTKYTRNVENDFINQNVSLKFKSQREKFNYTLGVGLEPSSSKTTIIIPLKDPNKISKSFLSFAPSGQFNYLWDKRHNLRIDYKGTTNQPTTTQLGISLIDGMNVTIGNPDLKGSFRNRLNIRYQKFNAERASFMRLTGGFTHTTNDIVSISTFNDAGGKTITYRNIDGNMGGNARFIFNTPLRNRSWSINSMSNAVYDIKNTFIDNSKNKAKTLTLEENVKLQFRSDILDFALRGNIQYNNMRNSISTNNNRNTYNYGGTYDFTLRFPNPLDGVTFFQHIFSNLTIDSDINYTTNSGYSAGFKLNEWLWNASISKQVFKNKAGTIRFKMYDILRERSNISRTYADDRITDTITNSLTSYFMVHFVYRFQIFKGGAKQADMEGMDEGRRGRGMDRPH